MRYWNEYYHSYRRVCATRYRPTSSSPRPPSRGTAWLEIVNESANASMTDSSTKLAAMETHTSFDASHLSGFAVCHQLLGTKRISRLDVDGRSLSACKVWILFEPWAVNVFDGGSIPRERRVHVRTIRGRKQSEPLPSLNLIRRRVHATRVAMKNGNPAVGDRKSSNHRLHRLGTNGVRVSSANKLSPNSRGKRNALATSGK